MNLELLERYKFHVLSGASFAAALATTRLGFDGRTTTYFFTALFGLAIAGLFVFLWGDRTRPRANLGWFLLALVLLAAIGATIETTLDPTYFRILPFGILVGFFLLHDLTTTPSLMLGAVVFSSVFHPEIAWHEEGDARAWWIGISVLLGVVAATFERERLQAKTAHITPWSWTIIRLAIVSIFTFVILTVKEELQTGKLFEMVGADPRGESGRWALLSILLAALVGATFLLRGKKPATPPTGPG
ncbi:MAG TPA: hypothetical protein VI818_05290 [Candidatus Thermoplasmatota archaeon]|nr:hypothetical protein [Candidatus Thermoplasmatota archaeon]